MIAKGPAIACTHGGTVASPLVMGTPSSGRSWRVINWHPMVEDGPLYSCRNTQSIPTKGIQPFPVGWSNVRRLLELVQLDV